MELLENEKQQQQENLPLNEKSQQIRLMKLLRRGKTLTAAYIDVGCVLDGFTTAELAEYYIKRFGDGGLRYFLEQQIIAAEISRDKAI